MAEQRSGRGGTGIRFGLSTSSVYPLGVEEAFKVASRLGYDGLEILVWSNPETYDVAGLADLEQKYQLPVMAVHAPTLLITQRVWGKEAWDKITGALDMAKTLGADTVVAHPPFRWQGDYAEGFVDGVRERAADWGVSIAVENMYPWRVGGRELPAYLPDHDPSDEDYEHITWDFSHAAIASADSVGIVGRLLRENRLRHIHLTDGSGSMKDEHLAPGRGVQPVAETLRLMAAAGWTGCVALEVSTRKFKTPAERDAELAYSLDFARTHLGSPDLASATTPGGA